MIPFAGVENDALPRRDTSLERLATLRPAFEANGTITAGNASAGHRRGRLDLGRRRRGPWRAWARRAAVKLVDWEIAAIDFRLDEGMLMAPGRAIPRLLARHGLTFGDIALYEIHEAFAAQVLANIKAASDPVYRRERAKVDADLGDFPWDRVNPHGGTLALGHPFAATGARILSQAAKELAAMPAGVAGDRLRLRRRRPGHGGAAGARVALSAPSCPARRRCP